MHRRNCILDAAEKIIFANGFEQSTMTAIAQEAELSKGTLYLYFDTKKELYIAIAGRGGQLLNSELSTILSTNKKGIELLQAMSTTYLAFVTNHPGYHHAFTYCVNLQNKNELQDSEEARICTKNREELMHMMIRTFEIGIRDGTIKNELEPHELATIVWGSMRGLILMTDIQDTNDESSPLKGIGMKIDMLFKNFIDLIGKGMATSEGAALI